MRMTGDFTTCAISCRTGRGRSTSGPALPAIAKAKIKDVAHKDASDYVGRMVDYVPARIENDAYEMVLSGQYTCAASAVAVSIGVVD
jgi:hypothetical protein